MRWRIFLVWFAFAGLAHATPEEDEARAAMRRGLAAFARRDAETALVEYKKAIALVPDANLPHRYAAEALTELERYEDAIAEYEKYLAIKPDVSDANDVRARIETVRRKISGSVALTSSPGGADVFVDDGPTRAGVTPIAKLELRRGPHKIVVKLAGRKDVVLTPTVKGGETLALACDFAEPSASQLLREEPRSRPVIGWIFLGAGATVLATSAILDATVLSSAYDDWNNKRKAGDPGALDKKHEVTTLQIAIGSGYIVGAVAAIVGGTILLWPRSSSRAGITITPTLGGISITVGGLRPPTPP
jgi:tetratricopeptide (TPR) repeat protein